MTQESFVFIHSALSLQYFILAIALLRKKSYYHQYFLKHCSKQSNRAVNLSDYYRTVFSFLSRGHEKLLKSCHFYARLIS